MILRKTLLTAMALSGAVLYAANKPVTVTLKDSAGKDVGTAKLSDGAGGKGVKVALNLKGLPAGQHAIHFHATAKCEGPKFTSAGGHFNPDMKHHGLDNPEGPHAGDNPNFTVKPNGTAKIAIDDPRMSLADGDPHSVFTGGGTALVIHAMPDDEKSDPAGNAGDRIACGVVAK